MRLILLGFLMLVAQVSASQDAYVTVDSKNTGLCFAYDDYANAVCNSSVLAVEGTKDGVIYIVPQASVTSRDNITTQFEYVALTPYNFIAGLAMFIGFLIGVITLFIVLGWILAGFAGGRT